MKNCGSHISFIISWPTSAGRTLLVTLATCGCRSRLVVRLSASNLHNFSRILWKAFKFNYHVGPSLLQASYRRYRRHVGWSSTKELASHWIRIATIVIYLVLQSTPAHVSKAAGYSKGAPWDAGWGFFDRRDLGVEEIWEWDAGLQAWVGSGKLFISQFLLVMWSKLKIRTPQ